MGYFTSLLFRCVSKLTCALKIFLDPMFSLFCLILKSLGSTLKSNAFSSENGFLKLTVTGIENFTEKGPCGFGVRLSPIRGYLIVKSVKTK
jgi:hypothetical protein